MQPDASEDIRSIIDKARLAGENGRVEEVGRLLEDSLSKNPESAELMAHLGYYYYRRGRGGRALAVFLRRNDLIEPDAGICRILAELYSKRGEYTKQRFWMKQAHWQDPQKTYAILLLYSFFKQFFSSIRRRCAHSNILRRCAYIFLCLQEKFSRGVIYIFEKFIPSRMYPESGDDSFRMTEFLRFARDFDALYRRDGLAFHKVREILIATRNLPVANRQANLLDVGTGLNTAPLFWAMKGSCVTAFDGSIYGFSHLKKVQEKISQENNSIRFHCVAGDGALLPFQDDAFDGASALCMLEHIPEDGDIHCMQEMFRTLKPGGLAVVTVEANSCSKDGWLEVPYAIGFQSGTDKPVQERGGYEEVYCRNYSPDDMIERLARSRPWEVVQSGFYDDRVLPMRRRLAPTHIFSPFLRGMQPLLSLLFFRPAAPDKSLSPSSIGYLILRKPL
ncbi:MAG: class I SAM-dependent methyltransferase [Candidatus Omnitrophica bacterium]|nr:class I SAM-dependent methyltransferase [Candidatus Omnitrophota bacterium]